MVLGREGLKQRMVGIHHQRQRAGRHLLAGIFGDTLEHCIIPIIGREESAYALLPNCLMVGHKQYAATLGQDAASLRIERRTDVDLLVLGLLG